MRGRVLTPALATVSFLLLASLSNASSGPPVTDQQQVSAAAPRSQQTTPATPAQPTTPALLKVSPPNRSVNVRPNAPVTVRATSGTLGAITLVNGEGEKVKGKTVPDGSWRASQLLHPSEKYTFTIAAIGPDGLATSTRSRFSTLKPKHEATYSLIPRGGTVGVGMPVIVQFDSAVTTRARRAEVEKRVTVTTSPVQKGAWGWLDNRQLMWRPKHYWRPGTRVTLAAPLHGVQTGRKKWITRDDGTSFTVGSSMVSEVDTREHTITVRRDGDVIRRFPVSTGKRGPSTETRSGIKVIIERSSSRVMDSATVGIGQGQAGYYRIHTKWNMRVTWTGEFLHSAPWSVGSQGSQNVSHGCTNMAPGDAEWMFKNSKMGDVVSFTGSSRAFLPTDGIGVWVYDYADWKAQSALARA